MSKKKNEEPEVETTGGVVGEQPGDGDQQPEQAEPAPEEVAAPEVEERVYPSPEEVAAADRRMGMDKPEAEPEAEAEEEADGDE